ncbi:MAG: recombination mediator RecR [Deltaproteobacteria bacterium]|nr:recombination mediator RecR [Deltaproteobacteria bacterium]MCL5793162.1 recombination mediator RecR [Deltaproteobacteria bacterium]
MTEIDDNPVTILVTQLKKLPGVGEKTAIRFAYHILGMQKDERDEISDSIKRVSDELRLCPICFNFTSKERCDICANPNRNNAVICVVEKPSDLYTIEKAGIFKSRYHVIHGVIDLLNNIGPEQLRIAELMQRFSKEDIKEVIIALSSGTEGEATAMYLQRMIKPFNIKVTRLASGIPMGSSLEYMDQYTIIKAIENRIEI